MNAGMAFGIGLLIGCGIAAVVNQSWYRTCSKMNDDWAKLCSKINADWAKRFEERGSDT